MAKIVLGAMEMGRSRLAEEALVSVQLIKRFVSDKAYFCSASNCWMSSSREVAMKWIQLSCKLLVQFKGHNALSH